VNGESIEFDYLCVTAIVAAYPIFEAVDITPELRRSA
jgi:hypothetical protein